MMNPVFATPFDSTGTSFGLLGFDSIELEVAELSQRDSRSSGRRISTMPFCKSICGICVIGGGVQKWVLALRPAASPGSLPPGSGVAGVVVGATRLVALSEQLLRL